MLPERRSRSLPQSPPAAVCKLCGSAAPGCTAAVRRCAEHGSSSLLLVAGRYGQEWRLHPRQADWILAKVRRNECIADRRRCVGPHLTASAAGFQQLLPSPGAHGQGTAVLLPSSFSMPGTWALLQLQFLLKPASSPPSPAAPPAALTCSSPKTLAPAGPT